MRYLIFFASLFFLQKTSKAQYKVLPEVPKKIKAKVNRAGCTQPTDVEFLDVNNVRALIMNGSDMWWDRALGTPSYEVPYNKSKNGNHSMALFAESLWIGGKDASSGVIKVAAQTYRQNSELDYWSGPVDLSGAITADECNRWDNIWKVEKTDINKFISMYKGVDFTTLELAEIPKVIKEWPGTGSVTAKGKNGAALNMGFRKYAPFIDLDGDGIYNYKKGDYPEIKGDQMLWFMINDVGNVKTSSVTLGIGLEISASAYAFATNDVLNEATFYEYDIVNRGATLDSTYISSFNCADLGDYNDDYIGCDVNRNMGIIYNGDNYDGGEFGYGKDIPMLGIDFLGGAKLRRIGLPDSNLGITAFTYFYNGNGENGFPGEGNQMYNYMSGKLKNGTPFVKTCTGFGVGAPYPFIFADNYKECYPCNNAPDDRTFVQSTGPITLYPGASNKVTLGVIWVPSVGGGCPSFGKLQSASDYIQTLFDQGFDVPIGPMAPDTKIIPYDKKFVFYLNNPYGSNNFQASFGNKDSSDFYKETSAQAIKNGSLDSLYKFEGYIVYQLKNENIVPSEIRNSDGSINEDKARIVFQCDRKNGIGNLINYETNNELNGTVFNAKLMVAGSDKGIVNNFEITEDAFALDNKQLVNYKTYHYLTVAYASNNFRIFDPSVAKATASITYLEGRKNARENPISIFSVMPTPAFNSIYSDNQTEYGSGVEVAQIEGKGNGGLNIELTEETEAQILNEPYFAAQPKYKASKTPIQIRITNPDSLKHGDYKVWLKGSIIDTNKGLLKNNATWFITRDLFTRVDTIFGEQNLNSFNEQLLAKWNTKNVKNLLKEDWGFSIGVGQTDRPSDNPAPVKNGFIESSIKFKIPEMAWLSGVKDASAGSDLANWLRTGTSISNMIYGINMSPYAPYLDPEDDFGAVINGTWGPYALANKENQTISRIGLRYFKNSKDVTLNPIDKINSIDVVFTNDRNKWSQCAVVEMNDGAATNLSQTEAPFSENGAYKYTLRKHPSLYKEVDKNGKPHYNNADSGRSWFPGYAINQETGERLNIVFGEDSGDSTNNGKDMIWNPTSTVYDLERGGLVVWGGHHIIYVLSSRYDGCNEFFNLLKPINDDIVNSNFTSSKQLAWHKASWVSPALLTKGFELASYKNGIVPTEARVKIRVSVPYNRSIQPEVVLQNKGLPLYQFNLGKLTSASLNSEYNTYFTEPDKLLARIAITPNPYNTNNSGFSYSNSLSAKVIRIINLPQESEIKIYSIEGDLIRAYKKNNMDSYLDWDLKNTNGLQISSGMYLVHVKIKTEQGYRETILKWFGVLNKE
jgi:hypothetical protein